MYNPMVTHESQRLEHLVREPPNEPSREPDKAVGLDELVEVDAQELHRDAEMASEVEVFRHLNDMVLLLGVLQHLSAPQLKANPYTTNPFPQVVQYLDLNQGLVVEPLLVSDDLDRDGFTSAMVTTVQHLAKRSLSERVYNFVAICEMVVQDYQVVSPLVVVAVVVGGVV